MTAELAIPLPEGASASDLQTTPARLQQHHVVPHGWHEIPLGQIATLQRGFDLPHRLRSTGPYPVVTSSGFDDGHADFMVSGPGVVTGRYGTIGEVFYCGDNFWPLNTTLYVRDFHGNHIRFIYYFLQQIDYKTHSGKSGVPGVNRNDLHGLIYAYPPDVREQRAIAEALSDADALIEGLERLIAKKRLIKEGAMQELLSGARRLPGFSGKWRDRRLDEVAEIRSGGTPSTVRSDFWNGNIPWCTPTDITALDGRKYITNTARRITELGLRHSSAEVIPPRSIIMTSRATIGECAINTSALTTNQGFKNLIPCKGICGEFLFYRMKTEKDRLIALCGGSTFLEIGKKQLAQFEVLMPDDGEEQSAIANALSEMDTEIEALDSKLDKARQIKQGMMQELLTGRIRLV